MNGVEPQRTKKKTAKRAAFKWGDSERIPAIRRAWPDLILIKLPSEPLWFK
jgi:hypothetical protein